jgi:hypothetical protein
MFTLLWLTVIFSPSYTAIHQEVPMKAVGLVLLVGGLVTALVGIFAFGNWMWFGIGVAFLLVGAFIFKNSLQRPGH